MNTVTTTQFVAPEVIDDEQSLRNLGRVLLLDQATQQEMDLHGTPTEIGREPMVGEEVGGAIAWRTPRPGEEPTGWCMQWSCATKPRETAEPEIGVVVTDGVAYASVPAPVVEASGGEVNIRHGLGGPVSITYRNAAGLPLDAYGIAVEVDADVIETHVPNGAVMAVITLDPDEDGEG